MRSRIAGLIVALCLPALLGADVVKDLLAQMDIAAASFTGVKASISKEEYTAILDDRMVESGTMWMARKGARSGDVRMRIEFTDPDPRSVAFAGKKAEIYYPKIKTVHEYDLGKHKSLVESFLLLGFGTSGKRLAKDFGIKSDGEGEVSGVAAQKLILTPKSAKARKKFVKIDVWLATDGAYPVKQVFHAASEDTTTIIYSDIEINPKLGDKDVSLDLPAGVKREYPQR